MELELGLALPASSTPGGEVDGLFECRKRGLAEAFGSEEEEAALPLFVRDDGSGRGGGGGEDSGDRGMSMSKRKKLVGWPPVKAAHRRRGGGGTNYVKVKMEGVAIGRKVDLSLHGSYEELLRTLDLMFPSTNQASTQLYLDLYAVTYEDGDGDWMLVGDVPWEAFAKSVKRLKILM